MGSTPARWRRGGLLLCRLRDTLRVCGPPKKQIEERSFLVPPQKAALGLASRPHSCLVPREKWGRKGENTVTEEIKTRQTTEETTNAVESGQRADTGSARYGAERKAMVSWAALLDEAVEVPGRRRKQACPCCRFKDGERH